MKSIFSKLIIFLIIEIFLLTNISIRHVFSQDETKIINKQYLAPKSRIHLYIEAINKLKLNDSIKLDQHGFCLNKENPDSENTIGVSQNEITLKNIEKILKKEDIYKSMFFNFVNYEQMESEEKKYLKETFIAQLTKIEKAEELRIAKEAEDKKVEEPVENKEQVKVEALVENKVEDKKVEELKKAKVEPVVEQKKEEVKTEAPVENKVEDQRKAKIEQVVEEKKEEVKRVAKVVEEKKVEAPVENKVEDKKVVELVENKEQVKVEALVENKVEDKKVVEPVENKVEDKKVEEPVENKVEDKKVVELVENKEQVKVEALVENKVEEKKVEALVENKVEEKKVEAPVENKVEAKVEELKKAEVAPVVEEKKVVKPVENKEQVKVVEPVENKEQVKVEAPVENKVEDKKVEELKKAEVEPVVEEKKVVEPVENKVEAKVEPLVAENKVEVKAEVKLEKNKLEIFNTNDLWIGSGLGIIIGVIAGIILFVSAQSILPWYGIFSIAFVIGTLSSLIYIIIKPIVISLINKYRNVKKPVTVEQLDKKKKVKKEPTKLVKFENVKSSSSIISLSKKDLALPEAVEENIENNVNENKVEKLNLPVEEQVVEEKKVEEKKVEPVVVEKKKDEVNPVVVPKEVVVEVEKKVEVNPLEVEQKVEVKVEPVVEDKKVEQTVEDKKVEDKKVEQVVEDKKVEAKPAKKITDIMLNTEHDATTNKTAIRDNEQRLYYCTRTMDDGNCGPSAFLRGLMHCILKDNDENLGHINDFNIGNESLKEWTKQWVKKNKDRDIKKEKFGSKKDEKDFAFGLRKIISDNVQTKDSTAKFYMSREKLLEIINDDTEGKNKELTHNQLLELYKNNVIKKNLKNNQPLWLSDYELYLLAEYFNVNLFIYNDRGENKNEITKDANVMLLDERKCINNTASIIIYCKNVGNHWDVLLPDQLDKDYLLENFKIKEEGEQENREEAEQNKVEELVPVVEDKKVEQVVKEEPEKLNLPVKVAAPVVEKKVEAEKKVEVEPEEKEKQRLADENKAKEAEELKKAKEAEEKRIADEEKQRIADEKKAEELRIAKEAEAVKNLKKLVKEQKKPVKPVKKAKKISKKEQQVPINEYLTNIEELQIGSNVSNTETGIIAVRIKENNKKKKPLLIKHNRTDTTLDVALDNNVTITNQIIDAEIKNLEIKINTELKITKTVEKKLKKALKTKLKKLKQGKNKVLDILLKKCEKNNKKYDNEMDQAFELLSSEDWINVLEGKEITQEQKEIFIDYLKQEIANKIKKLNKKIEIKILQKATIEKVDFKDTLKLEDFFNEFLEPMKNSENYNENKTYNDSITSEDLNKFLKEEENISPIKKGEINKNEEDIRQFKKENFDLIKEIYFPEKDLDNEKEGNILSNYLEQEKIIDNVLDKLLEKSKVINNEESLSKIDQVFSETTPENFISVLNEITQDQKEIFIDYLKEEINTKIDVMEAQAFKNICKNQDIGKKDDKDEFETNKGKYKKQFKDTVSEFLDSIKKETLSEKNKDMFVLIIKIGQSA